MCIVSVKGMSDPKEQGGPERTQPILAPKNILTTGIYSTILKKTTTQRPPVAETKAPGGGPPPRVLGEGGTPAHFLGQVVEGHRSSAGEDLVEEQVFQGKGGSCGHVAQHPSLIDRWLRSPRLDFLPPVGQETVAITPVLCPVLSGAVTSDLYPPGGDGLRPHVLLRRGH